MSLPPEQQPFDAIVLPERAPPTNPGSFGLIGSLCILLAVMGLVGLCMSGMMVTSNLSTSAPLPPPPDATAMQRFEYELTTAAVAGMRQYVNPQIGFMVAHVFVAGALLIGGILALRRTARGRKVLLYVLLIAILFELLRTGMYILMLLDMMPIVDEAMQRTMREFNNRPAGEQMEKIMRRISQGITVAAVIFVLVWPGIKLLFYGWSARYLAGEEARDLCHG